MAKPRTSRLAFAAFGVILAGSFLYLVIALRQVRSPIDEPSSRDATQVTRDALRTSPRLGTPEEPVTSTQVIPPWEARPENTPPLPPGYVPAYALAPPRPGE